MKCHLLYIVGQLRSGGLERQLYYLLHTMDRERYRPAVVVWNYHQSDTYVRQVEALGVPIYAIPNSQSPMTKLRALRNLVDEIEPAVVHSYSFYTNVAAEWASTGAPAVPVGSIRSDPLWAIRQSGPLLGHLSALRPHHQICNSYSAANAIQGWGARFTPRRLHVVRNGIDLNRFRSIPQRRTSPIRIAAVGNLFAVKRWERLLIAAREFTQRRIDYRITIAGEGPLRPSLEQHARELGVAANVRFIGHSDDVPALLSDSTLLAHTAESEGCPNAVMEAMAAGRPVVAMAAGEIPLLVDNGRNGFVVPQGDNRAFVDCLITVCTDGHLAKRMGDAGRAKAEEEFGLARLVEATLRVYREAGWKDV